MEMSDTPETGVPIYTDLPEQLPPMNDPPPPLDPDED